jgi:hypothetical protein
MKRESILKRFFIISLFAALTAGTAFGQGTGFNFQGRLNDGTNPANGAYDLQFKLFNAAAGGTQIGSTIARTNTALINGVFSVTLDFGAAAFNNPNSVFIEIAVRPNASPNAFTILGPRQQLTVVPFAVRANNATNADNSTNAVNAQNATNAGNALNSANSSLLEGLAARDFIRNSTTTMPNSNFNISGNGIINGNLIVQGNNTSGGNVAQNRDKGGLVKAMLYVNPNGTIARCYNGVTGSSTNGCGFLVEHKAAGYYQIDFGFQVNDRFVSLTPGASSVVNIVASFYFYDGGLLPNILGINTNITDVDNNDSNTDDDFMVIVY